MDKKIYSYQAYLTLRAINESIDDIIQNASTEDASQIQDLVNSQEEIFNKYDISPTEIDNIKNSVEDTIRVKLGIDFKEGN